MEQKTPVSLPVINIDHINTVHIKSFQPGEPSAQLDLAQSRTRELLLPLINAINSAKQVRPRDIASTPEFTVDIQLDTGERMLFLYNKGKSESVMAIINQQAVWIDSEELVKTLAPLGYRLTTP